MRRLVLLSAAPLALTACNSGKIVKAENASFAEVAEAAEGVVKFDSGKWQNKVSFISAEASGFPSEQVIFVEQMAKTSNHTTANCLTNEMVDTPGGPIFAGMDNGQCRYERFEMGDGRIDAVIVCKESADRPAALRITTVGNFTPTTYDMTREMTMTVTGAGGASGETMVRTKLVGQRVGECDVPEG